MDDPGFDAALYTRTNPDVRLGGFEPFAHYATRGWREGRESRGGLDASGSSAGAAATRPSEAEWNALPPPPDAIDPRVDVVVPIYAGRDETLRTLHRLLSARGAHPFHVVAVDDASPDEVIAARLGILARDNHIELLTNPTNRGFVASANRGMALHRDRDVILLNADTEVFGDWADRLRRRAYRFDDIGTVTPWSSDATILSYPIRLRPNRAMLEATDERLDEIAARLDLPEVEIPTAVGFCMFVRRACLDEVGPLDERRFGRGYGEENDFCRRAARLGWKHLAATDVFVRHHGGRSFGADKDERLRVALATMASLHPGYRGLIHRFNAVDPLRACRQAFDEARVRAAAPTSILTDGLSATVAGMAGAGTITAVPAPGPGDGSVDLWPQSVPIVPNLPPLRPDTPRADVRARLEALGIAAVQIWDDGSPVAGWLRSVAALCRLPLYGPGP